MFESIILFEFTFVNLRQYFTSFVKFIFILFWILFIGFLKRSYSTYSTWSVFKQISNFYVKYVVSDLLSKKIDQGGYLWKWKKFSNFFFFFLFLRFFASIGWSPENFSTPLCESTFLKRFQQIGHNRYRYILICMSLLDAYNATRNRLYFLRA